MSVIVLASEDERLRVALSAPLLESGYAVDFASTWQNIIQAISRAATRVLVVDANLPGIAPRASLLCELVETLENPPRIFCVSGDLGTIPRVTRNPINFRRMVTHSLGPAVSRTEREHLKLMGLGRRPMHALARLARSRLPVCLEAERGMGKKRVAQVMHTLGGGGPFVSFKATETPSLPTDPRAENGLDGSFYAGTLYLPVLEEWPHERIADTARWAADLGWRFILGTRLPLKGGLDDWTHLHLPPLRERPKDLHGLTLFYLERNRKALGLPRRRFGKRLWALVRAHNWYGNARELESFVVAVLSSTDRYMIHPEHLPQDVRERVDPPPDAEARRETRDFESTVEIRLRKVVSLYEPGGDQPLGRMVMDATERPLIKLALARCGGSKKDAARLLGMNRNTLHSHMLRLGLHAEDKGQRQS